MQVISESESCGYFAVTSNLDWVWHIQNRVCQVHIEQFVNNLSKAALSF